jgi:hypothetical protein
MQRERKRVGPRQHWKIIGFQGNAGHKGGSFAVFILEEYL